MIRYIPGRTRIKVEFARNITLGDIIMFMLCVAALGLILLSKGFGDYKLWFALAWVIISIAFFNDIYKRKQNKFVLIVIAVILYGIEFLAFCIFDNTIVNILSFFLVNIIILNGCYFCKIKSSIISSLFLSVALTASEFLIMNLLAIGLKKDVYVYLSSPYLFIIFLASVSDNKYSDEQVSTKKLSYL